MSVARIASKLISKIKPRPKGKKRGVASPKDPRNYPGNPIYKMKDRASREKYKKKHGMYPEDDPRNYSKSDKGAQKAIKRMGLKKKAKGGMVISGPDFVAKQYD